MMSHSAMDTYNVNDNFHQREGSMSTMARTRLMRDLKTLQDDAPAGISGAPEYDNIMKWTAMIFGPSETEWEGGTFKLSQKFSKSYPYNPPMVRFACHMFHPNVDIGGSIWLDILNDHWNPSYDVAAILISVQSLLCDPNTDNPVNKEAGQLFRNNKHEYNQTVRVVVELSWMDDQEKYEALTSLSDRFINRFCISDSLLKR